MFFFCASLQAKAKFLLVQEAWETLRDVDLRQDYDCRLELQGRNVVISDEVRVITTIAVLEIGRTHTVGLPYKSYTRQAIMR